jgi:hypothetical protein
MKLLSVDQSPQTLSGTMHLANSTAGLEFFIEMDEQQILFVRSNSFRPDSLPLVKISKSYVSRFIRSTEIGGGKTSISFLDSLK